MSASWSEILPGARPPVTLHCVQLEADQRRLGRLVAALMFAAGVAVGLLAAVSIIPDQPSRILIPVDAPAVEMPHDRGAVST